jgi:hypothetical protein
LNSRLDPNLNFNFFKSNEVLPQIGTDNIWHDSDVILAPPHFLTFWPHAYVSNMLLLPIGLLDFGVSSVLDSYGNPHLHVQNHSIKRQLHIMQFVTWLISHVIFLKYHVKVIMCLQLALILGILLFILIRDSLLRNEPSSNLLRIWCIELHHKLPKSSLWLHILYLYNNVLWACLHYIIYDIYFHLLFGVASNISSHKRCWPRISYCHGLWSRVTMKGAPNHFLKPLVTRHNVMWIPTFNFYVETTYLVDVIVKF